VNSPNLFLISGWIDQDFLKSELVIGTKVKPSNGKSNKENSISSLDDIDVNQGTTSIND
jgi:hypothetical protein